jgi:hypothetical protein
LTTPSGEWHFRLAVAAQACPDADTVPQSCARPQPVDRGPAKEERQVPDSVKPRLCGHSHHTNDERHRNAQHQIHLYPTEKSLLLALPPATRGSFWIRHLIIRRLPIVDNLLRLSLLRNAKQNYWDETCALGVPNPRLHHTSSHRFWTLPRRCWAGSGVLIFLRCMICDYSPGRRGRIASLRCRQAEISFWCFFVFFTPSM